jgi:hypothetical protein
MARQVKSYYLFKLLSIAEFIGIFTTSDSCFLPEMAVTEACRTSVSVAGGYL